MALVRWRCATGDERVLACTRVYSPHLRGCQLSLTSDFEARKVVTSLVPQLTGCK